MSRVGCLTSVAAARQARAAEHDVGRLWQDMTTTSNISKTSVLFTCIGNTCRSVMAEYICQARFGEHFSCESAGLRPQKKADAENAVYTLQRLLKIDASAHQPRNIRSVDLSQYDYIVAMHGSVAKDFIKTFPDFPREKIITWKIDDPYGDDLSEYEACAQKIFRQLKHFSEKIRQKS